MRILIALAALVAMVQVGTAYGGETPSRCPVTPQPRDGMLRSEALSAPIMPTGTITFGADRPGFVLPDGALMIKYGWIRRKKGEFSIHGRRLDGSAPPLRARIAERMDESDPFQPASLIFPTPGCWEVTGQLGKATLTFVVRVISLGGSPPWETAFPADRTKSS